MPIQSIIDIHHGETKSSLISHTFAKYAFILVVTTIVGYSSLVIDTFFAGFLLKEEGVAAIGLINPLDVGINGIGLMIPAGAAVVSAHALGKKDVQGFRKIFSLSIMWALLISIVLCLIVYFCAEPYANFFCQIGDTNSPEIAGYVVDYLRIYAFSFPIAYMLQAFVAISRIDANPYLSLIACFAMPIANIVFKFVFLNMNLGMTGIALATLLSLVVAAIIVATHFFSKNNNFSFVLPKGQILSRFFHIAKFGVSELNSELSCFGFGFVANLLLAIYVGPDGLVAFALLQSITKICGSIHFGINQSGSYLSALMYGEEDRVGLRQSLTLSISGSFAVTLCVAILVLIFPEQIVQFFFVDDPEASQMAIKAICIYAMVMPLNSIIDAFAYYFNSVERVLYANIICNWQYFTSSLIFMLIACPTLPQAEAGMGVWASCVFSGITSLILVAGIIIFANKRMNAERGYVLQGFMNNLLLCPVSFALDWLYSVQFKAIHNMDDAIKISKNCHNVLVLEQYDKRKSYIFALAIEEMARNTLANGFPDNRKNKCIEVKVVLRAHKKVMLMFRDNAINFNPLKFEAKDKDDFTDVGIKMIKNLVSNIRYSDALEINSMAAEFDFSDTK